MEKRLGEKNERLGEKNERLGEKNEKLGEKNGYSHPLFQGSFMWECLFILKSDRSGAGFTLHRH